MPIVRVTSPNIARLASNIKAHADGKALRRELNRGLNSVSKPLRAEMRAAAVGSMPVSGGLRARMEAIASKGRVTPGGARAGVRVNFAKKGYDPRTLRGYIKHPLYGNRRLWFTTPAPTDEIEHEFQRQRPEVQRVVAGVMDDIARKVTS